MSSNPTVYVVTGATRGIGFALVEQLSTRPDTVVYAGTRSLPLPNASQLAQLAAKHPEVVIPIKINSADEADNVAAAEVIKAKYGYVSVVIANAGSHSGTLPISELQPHHMLSDFETNVLGPLALFNKMSSLLLAANEASPGSAKFMVVSSLVGSIAELLPYPYTAYATSKAAVNFVVAKINQEYHDIVAFPTRQARKAAGEAGLTIEAFGAITPLASATGLLSVVDKATKESHGGKFWNYTGEELRY